MTVCDKHTSRVVFGKTEDEATMALSSKNPRDLVQRIVEKQVKEVPEEFLVPIHERPHPTQKNTGLLPFIDLAGLEDSKEETLREIAKACEEWGFFQRVPGKQRGQFFELPMKEKAQYAAKDQSIEGLIGYGHTDFFKGTANDWMDSLFGYLAPASLKSLDMWPSQPEGLREMVDCYGTEVHKLFKRLLAIMSENLGMQPSYLEEAFLQYNLFFRANYYPPCPEPDLVLGTHSHKDHGSLTVLLQDKDMDGLQVCKDGQWFSVEPVPNALVVNIGDQMQRITNGKYKSAEHRGVVSSEKTIMTMVAHLDPPAGAAVAAH